MHCFSSNSVLTSVKPCLHYQSMMVYAEAVTSINQLRELEPLDVVDGRNLQERIPITIIQILANILSSQNTDATWGPRGCAETTAYALLTLTAIGSLPYILPLQEEIRHAIASGHQTLLQMSKSWAEDRAMEIDKVTDGPPMLSRAYTLIAMRKAIIGFSCAESASKTDIRRRDEVLAFSRYFSSLDHMKKESLAMIKASVLEGCFYVPLLKARRTDIFPATDANEKDKYFNYIPPLWIFTSTCRRIFLPPECLLDMMIRSMFIFLVDEYMESNVALLSTEELTTFRDSIKAILSERSPSELHRLDLTTQQTLKNKRATDTGHLSPATLSDRLRAAISVFETFASSIMTYPTFKNASATDLLELRSETKNYLLSHVAQIEDNARFVSQTHHRPSKRTKFPSPRTPYHVWAHTTGAGHISGPFSFALFTCSMSGGVRNGKSDCFKTVRQKIQAYIMNLHISAYCRMYNDYGSITRDRAEGNLNSINFPEFFPLDDRSCSGNDDVGGQGVDGDQERAKATLLEAAEYERQRAVEAAEPLLKELYEGEVGEESRIADALRVYIGCCEHFSDLYLYRDVTNSVR